MKQENKENKKQVYACELCNNNCMGCFYADECGDWLDNPAIPVPKVWVPVEKDPH